MREDARVEDKDARGLTSIRRARNARPPIEDAMRCHWCGHPEHSSYLHTGECAYCPCMGAGTLTEPPDPET